MENEERAKQIEQRATALLIKQMQTVKDKLNDMISNGSIDEAIALNVSQNKPECVIIKELHHYNKIDYDLVLRDEIVQLKLLYEPHYRVYSGHFGYNNEYYILSIAFFEKQCCILF